MPHIISGSYACTIDALESPLWSTDPKFSRLSLPLSLSLSHESVFGTVAQPLRELLFLLLLLTVSTNVYWARSRSRLETVSGARGGPPHLLMNPAPDHMINLLAEEGHSLTLCVCV